MSSGVTITNKVIKQVDFLDAPTSYQTGSVNDKYKLTIDFYFLKQAPKKSVVFDSTTKTITLISTIPGSDENLNDQTSFVDDYNFLVGETFEVVGSVLNIGTFTILSLTDTVITTVESMVNETVYPVDINITPAVRSLEFFYNLIANNEQETYMSKTDRNTLQKYIVSSLDASDTTTHKPLLIGTDSFGWVTEEYTGLNVCAESYIIGMGIVDYKQQYRLVHYYFITPLALLSQYQNFRKPYPPDYFLDEEISGAIINNALKYICKINGKYIDSAPDIQYTSDYTANDGLTAWFDQNEARTRPEYILESIGYTDAITMLETDRLDFSRPTNVEITIYSNSGLFVDKVGSVIGTRLVLQHIYLPLIEDDYINTQTTLRQNFMNDRLAFAIDHVGHIGGEYYGTNYEVFNDIQSTFIDANTIKVNFQVLYSDYLKSVFKSKAASNRNYALILTTEKHVLE